VFGFSDGTKFRWEEGYFVLNDEIAENAIKSYEAGKYSESVKVWMKYAPYGCAASAIGLSMAYWNGNGISRDLKKSFFWLIRGTLRRSDPTLYINLSVHYKMGDLTPKNKIRAIYCALIALQLNNNENELVIEKANNLISELLVELSDEEIKVYDSLRSLSDGGFTLNSKMVGLFRDMISEL
jgi:TPR repeat protein